MKYQRLAAYAQYLLNNQLDDYIRLQQQLSTELDLQLMRPFLELPSEEQDTIARNTATHFLTVLAENRGADHIGETIHTWINNLLSFIDKYVIIAEEVPKVSYIRRRLFLHFLPGYTVDLGQSFTIIEELDAFLLQYELVTNRTYTHLLEEKIAANSYFISRINDTLPGALYIFDTVNYQNLYANEQLEAVIGYSPAELNAMREEAVESLIHPEDASIFQDHRERCKRAKDGEILSYKYRVRSKDGTYKWLRNFESVFKRSAGGDVIQVIAITLNIDAERKIAEQLRQNEKLYKQAQSLVQMGNWVMDLKTRQFTWSDEMYTIYEMDKSEKMTEEGWYNWIHPEDRDGVYSYFQECVREKKLYDKTHRIVLRNGTVKTIHRKGEFFYNNKGEPVEMIGSTQDITEQHRVQQELERGQRFIKKITDATPSIITTYDINTGKYLFVSEGIEKLLGYQSARVYEKGVAFFMDITHPEDLLPTMSKNTAALEDANNNPGDTEPVVEFTYRVKHADGDYRWLHTYGVVFERGAANEVIQVLNISLDVTAQKEATQKIEDQEYFIKQIAEASPTILYLFDIAQSHFVYTNREIFYVLGYTPEEMASFDEAAIQALYHPDDLSLLPERKGSESRFHYKESMMQYECRMRHKNGNWTWLLVREIAFKKGGDEAVLQVLGAALDISKRKEMEGTLLQNAFQLEQSNASLEEFAYVASHDLKEPLRKISTFGDRLEATQTERLDDSGKIYLKKIVDASQRMQLMIDDLLSVSMITGNRAFQPHSLQAILEDARQAVEHKLEQRGAVIEAAALPEAIIVASQFRQLFQNLISNSLKFVREGVPPEIQITCEYLAPAELTHLNLTKAASYLKLEFKDNGIGFENEFAGKIFQIFQRLHGRSEYEGTGIGLAICKKIVEHHSGVIYANGVQGQGATFTILLPQ